MPPAIQRHVFSGLGGHFVLQLGEERPSDLSSSEVALLQQEIDRIESRFSRFLPESELSELNRGLGAPRSISQEMSLLLQFASLLFEETAGYFDIGLESTLIAWGYDGEYSFRPDSPEPLPCQRPRDTPAFTLSSDGSSVELFCRLDFGGFGKGYVLSRLRHLLQNMGQSHALLNAGGDLLAWGSPRSGVRGWQIALEDPSGGEAPLLRLSLTNGALCGSSPLRRQWGRYHHLIDPVIGLPAETAQASWALDPDPMRADSWATALMSLSPEALAELSPPSFLRLTEGSFSGSPSLISLFEKTRKKEL